MNSEIFYDKKIFAENLCRLMKESGERQTDIAKLLKVSKSTVSEYCKGQQMPRMDKIEMLSIHFGVSKSELLESSELTGSTSPYVMDVGIVHLVHLQSNEFCQKHLQGLADVFTQ